MERQVNFPGLARLDVIAIYKRLGIFSLLCSTSFAWRSNSELVLCLALVFQDKFICLTDLKGGGIWLEIHLSQGNVYLFFAGRTAGGVASPASGGRSICTGGAVCAGGGRAGDIAASTGTQCEHGAEEQQNCAGESLNSFHVVFFLASYFGDLIMVLFDWNHLCNCHAQPQEIFAPNTLNYLKVPPYSSILLTRLVISRVIR